MSITSARGARAKAKTKKWLEAQGYIVGDLEIVKWVYRPGGKRLPVKKDQFASDLIGVRADHIAWVQVKGGKTAKAAIPAALRAFSAFHWPPGSVQMVVAWPLRAREPIVKYFERDAI